MPDVVHRGTRGRGDGAPRVRCAIYTRKSSDEGLEQEFNSLHAQREACEAYVLSQRHEGWLALETVYDDGGFSGGSMRRPALERLLADISAGLVDVVVVYKIDRLTRSLFDFAKIVEILEGAKASFVSVTQSFNTTSSMGRLTLNVLLSFAQFEREVTGERIRDKIAASRAKGMFMGGNVPIGYDLRDHALVPQEAEAKLVGEVFQAYFNGASITEIKQHLDRRGATTKRKANSGGRPFTTGHLYWILRNPVYVGKTRHKGNLYEGRHAPIVDPELWTKVQKKLDASHGGRGKGTGRASANWLAGLVRDADGHRYAPTSAKKGNKVYRYYSLKGQGDGSTAPRNIPARELEAMVVRAVVDELTSTSTMRRRLDTVGISVLDHAKVMGRARAFAELLTNDDVLRPPHQVRELIEDIVVEEDQLAISLAPAALMVALDRPFEPNHDKGTSDWIIRVPYALTKARRHRKAVIRDAAGKSDPMIDPSMANAILRARRWWDILLKDCAGSISDLAASEKVNRAWISGQLPLAFLAPDIAANILDGHQPLYLTLKMLTTIASTSSDWADQREAIINLPTS